MRVGLAIPNYTPRWSGYHRDPASPHNWIARWEVMGSDGEIILTHVRISAAQIANNPLVGQRRSLEAAYKDNARLTLLDLLDLHYYPTDCQ